MLGYTELVSLIGEQVKAVGSCGIGKGVSVEGKLLTTTNGEPTIMVVSKVNPDRKMIYSVSRQSIEKI